MDSKPAEQIKRTRGILGILIKDKSKLMERWVEHYSELYARMNVVSEEALMAMESLSTMDEFDSEPTLEEINQALDQLSSGKAPGNAPVRPQD